MLCSATADFTGFADGALGLSGPPGLSSVDPQLKGMLYMPGVFKPQSFLMWQKKLAALLDGRPEVLYV
jgi:hypothetical protein